MSTRIAVGFGALLLIASALSVSAHHSHPLFYDQCNKLTLEGRVDSVQWKNPHILVVIKMDDGSTYTAEWASLQELTTRNIVGPAQAALMPGSRVVVVGNPLRDPAQIRASFPDLPAISNTKVVDLLQIRRTDDSWSWAQQSPPPCK